MANALRVFRAGAGALMLALVVPAATAMALEGAYEPPRVGTTYRGEMSFETIGEDVPQMPQQSMLNERPSMTCQVIAVENDIEQTRCDRMGTDERILSLRGLMVVEQQMSDMGGNSFIRRATFNHDAARKLWPLRVGKRVRLPAQARMNSPGDGGPDDVAAKENWEFVVRSQQTVDTPLGPVDTFVIDYAQAVTWMNVTGTTYFRFWYSPELGFPVRQQIRAKMPAMGEKAPALETITNINITDIRLPPAPGRN